MRPADLCLLLLGVPALAPGLTVPADEALPDETTWARWQRRLDDLSPGRGLSTRWRTADVTRPGGPRVYTRWELAATGWQAFFLSERDPGERGWADHWVAYADWRGRSHRLVAGDLRPGFGQGLIFGRGSGRGSGRPRREAAALGARSSAESQAVRGVAWRGRGRVWQVTALAAGLRWDARFDTGGAVRRLPRDGLHTGRRARQGRKALAGAILGLRLRYDVDGRSAGLTFQRLAFDRLLRLTSTRGGLLFTGRRQLATGVDLSWRRGRLRLYGEAVRTPTAGGVLGGIVGLGPRQAQGSLQWHRYGSRLFLPLGGADRRWATANESGWVTQVRGRGWRLWLEQAQRPGRFSDPVPDAFREVGGQGAWRRQGWRLEIDGRVRHAQTWRDGVRRERTDRQRLRLSHVTTAHHLRLNRWWSRSSGERGQAWGADGRLRLPRLDLRLQWTGYRIPGWASRIYEAEATLPGSVSIRPLRGHGWRAVVTMGLRHAGWHLSAAGRLEVRHGSRRRVQASLQIDRNRSRRQSR